MSDETYSMGTKAFNGGEIDVAREIWRELAEVENGRYLRRLFSEGFSAPLHADGAPKWLEIAAEIDAKGGSSYFSCELGCLYATGIRDGTGLYASVAGLDQNFQDAEKWFRKARDLGNLRAEIWFRSVKRHGHAGAHYWMAEYEYGYVEEGISHNEAASGEWGLEPDTMLRWARAAAELGGGKECMLLCTMLHDYYFSHPIVWQECAKWYRRGRQSGHPHDPKVLWFQRDPRLPLFGDPPKEAPDIDKDVVAISARAKKGSLPNQRLLGQYYAGTSPPDFVSALAWLRAGMSHSYGGRVPDWQHLEDRAIGTWRLLELILEGNELKQSKALESKIKHDHPPKLRKVARIARRLLPFVGKDSHFEAYLNVALAIYTYRQLEEPLKRKVREVAQSEFEKSNPRSTVISGMEPTPLPPVDSLVADMQSHLCVFAMRRLGIKPVVEGEKWRRVSRRLLNNTNRDLDARGDAIAYLVEHHGVSADLLDAGAGGIFNT